MIVAHHEVLQPIVLLLASGGVVTMAAAYFRARWRSESPDQEWDSTSGSEDAR